MRTLFVFLCALALVPNAVARTDGGRQLAFSWPANGVETSPYGWDEGRWHPGIDIGILRSLEIRAAESGVVVRVGTPHGYEGYGNVVEVQVNERYSNLYAHLSRAAAPRPRPSHRSDRFDVRLQSALLGRLAQLGEHQLDKLGVTGSSPVPPIA